MCTCPNPWIPWTLNMWQFTVCDKDYADVIKVTDYEMSRLSEWAQYDYMSPLKQEHFLAEVRGVTQYEKHSMFSGWSEI